MRWNRGTIVLIATLLVIIVVVLVINNNQASAPGDESPTPGATTGVLLPELGTATVARYEVRNNETGDFVALTRNTGGAWEIDATNVQPDRDPEQSLIDTTIGQIAALEYANTFTESDLGTFGLDTPAYTILVTTEDGELYLVYVGDKSPTSARYYAVVEQASAPEATSESTTVPGAFDVQPGESIATQSFNAGDNPNVIGGVDLSDVTAESQVDAAATLNAMTSPDMSPPDAATEEATAEATFEAQEGEAVATEVVSAGEPGGNPDDNFIGGVDLEDVTAEAQATLEATAEMTVEATAETTPERIGSPEVRLSGEQTIYLIPQTVIDTLVRWLDTPPYAPEATASPLLEVTEEATAESTDLPIDATPVLEEGARSELIPEGTAVATQEATDEP